MSAVDFGVEGSYWICEPCDWFITPSALQWQVSLGLQEWPWRCPECKNILIEEEPDK